MKVDFSPSCQKKLTLIKGKNLSLFKLITKQLLCFQSQVNHPSLRLHKLKGELNDSWSISINRSIRMLFYYREVKDEKKAVFFDVGTHREVYK